MTEATTIEKRIAALMAKADSTEHAEEAQAFYAKAEELMLRYAVDRVRLEQVSTGGKARPEEPIITMRIPFQGISKRWASLGVMGAALINTAVGLTGIAVDRRNKVVVLYGRESDCGHVRTLIEAVWRQGENHLRTWRKVSQTYLDAYEASRVSGNRRQYRGVINGYVVGFCRGAANKIQTTRDEFTKKDVGSELVLVSIQDRIQDYMSGKTQKARAGRQMNGNYRAETEGYQDGQSASLAAEVGR